MVVMLHIVHVVSDIVITIVLEGAGRSTALEHVLFAVSWHARALIAIHLFIREKLCRVSTIDLVSLHFALFLLHGGGCVRLVTEDILRSLEHVILLTSLSRSCHPVFIALLFLTEHVPAGFRHLLPHFLCCLCSLILLWLRLMVQQ